MDMTPEMVAGLSIVGTLLGFAAGAVFFIACANVSLFLLGRAFTRFHETALRVALGASRGQLAGELLSDSAVISVAGGAAGVWTSRLLPTLLYDADAERLAFVPDLLSVAGASAACAGITILCGLLPVLVIRHDRPATVLRRESAGPSPAIRRLRLGLVIAQMASCCVLVIATAVMLDGLRTALVTSTGHRVGSMILASVQAHPDVGSRYFHDVEEATKSIGGVSGIEWDSRMPGTLPTWRSFRIEPMQLPFRDLTLDIAWLTPDSLKLFATPPRAGRMFGLGDQTCRVAIVNEEAAEELFAENTVGRTIQDPAGLPVEVIGVVAIRNSGHAPKKQPTIYYNYSDQTGSPPDPIALARFRAPIATELASADLDTHVVSPGYFEAVGAKLIAGQGFAGHTSSTQCRIGVVNQEAADRYFGGTAVGSAVIDVQGIRTAIIGVVEPALLGTFQRHAEPAIYFPMSQDALPRMTMNVRTRAENSPTVADVQRVIGRVPGMGPAPPVVKTLDTHLAQTSLAPLRIATMIFGASATLALLLSIAGLFGALSDAARERRRELAIRIALGAQRWRVICHVLGEGGRLGFAGVIAGTLASLLLWRPLTRIIPGTGSPALWVWFAAPLVLVGVVVIASLLPARGALIVNPLMIVRDEN
jgi:ABC-type antimicrobial peptide transport system permease subunit